MRKYKCHCSGIGAIMAKAVGGREISVGATTAVETWARTQIYNRKPSHDSKHTLKGKEVEAYAVGYLANIENEFYLKNSETYENDWIIGTPDIVADDEIIDIKCPWDCFTFPLFDEALPNNDYFWQLQGYMWLTGKRYSRVVYLLIDAPDHLIEREIRRALYDANCLQDDEIEQQVRKRLTYDDVPEKYRVKSFKVEYDEQAIEQIKNRVEACQRYAETLLKRIL